MFVCKFTDDKISSNKFCHNLVNIEGFNEIPDGEQSDIDYNRIKLTVPNPALDLEVEKSFLIENNFELINAIDFNKGCYIGQENTARQKYRGNAKKKQ